MYLSREDINEVTVDTIRLIVNVTMTEAEENRDYKEATAMTAGVLELWTRLMKKTEDNKQ